MAYVKKLKIVDDTNLDLQLEVYINGDNRIFLNVGEINTQNREIYSGYITMDKEDVQVLIDELNQLKDTL